VDNRVLITASLSGEISHNFIHDGIKKMRPCLLRYILWNSHLAIPAI
jgi:hypothetical protein